MKQIRLPQTKIISQNIKLFSSENFFKKEEVRSEYVEYAKEMEYLVDKLKPTIKAYIEDCGRVKTVPINKFELPPEITKKIGKITREG